MLLLILIHHWTRFVTISPTIVSGASRSGGAGRMNNECRSAFPDNLHK
jgi:hypothetical protein